MNTLKKTVYTLCVNDYAPEITALTFPLMERYAEKIGADFYVIDEVKFPDAPCFACEKFQLGDLAREHKNDWNIFFDADTLIHPDFFDITTVIDKDTTVSNGTDFLPIRFKPNEYHLRDGRMIGKGNWMAVVSDWCLDYWHKPEGDWNRFSDEITPTVAEQNFGVRRGHLVDDYIVSMNISRFGLKHKLVRDIQYAGIQENLLFHQYLMSEEQKAIEMNKVMQAWGI